MTFFRTLTLIVCLGLLANFGCSSSSPGTTSSTVVTTVGITTCTSSTSTPNCLPTLGNYGNIVEYQGRIAVSDAAILQTLIKGVPGENVPSQSFITSNSYIDILLQATPNGPSIAMTILLGQLPQNTLPIQVPGFPWTNILTGFTQFTAATSNPSAGIIEMDVAGLSIVDPIDINSLTYPWDGSLPDMPPMAITIGSAPVPPATGSAPTFGTVGLIRVQ